MTDRKDPPKLGEVFEIISRWIKSCINEEQLKVCEAAIENCILQSPAWEDEKEGVVANTVELLLRSVKQRSDDLYSIIF